jgi:hypothetical protein
MAVELADPFAPVEGKCNSRKTDGSGRCRHEAGWGTDHVGEGQCRKHGGNTSSARKSAAKKRQARELSELMAAERELLGDNPDPHEGVMEVVLWRWAYRRVIEGLVEELLDRTRGKAAALHDEERPHVLIAMLHEATEAHLKACRIAIESGIAERQLRLEEDRVELLARVIRGVLVELGVWDQPETPGVVKRHLRSVMGGIPA